jgi:hypothetical protein
MYTEAHTKQLYLLDTVGSASTQNCTFLDMFPLSFIFLLLQLPLHLSSFSNPDCFPSPKPSVYKDGDVVIAVFFLLYSFVIEDTSGDSAQQGISTK